MATLQTDIKLSALLKPKPLSGNDMLDHPVKTGVGLGLGLSFGWPILSAIHPLLGTVFGLSCLGLLVWLLYNVFSRQHRHLLACLQQFAVDNGFTFAENATFLSEAAIFQVGRNHKTRYVFTGKLLDYPLCFYWHQFTTGSGKYQKTHYYGVVELQLPKTVPHIFLDDRSNNFLGSELLDSFNGDNLIKLEGDFPKHFNVYAAEGYHIEVLTLLNPAFMHTLVDRLMKEEIELFGNSAFIYCDDMLAPTVHTIPRLLSEAEFLIAELKKQLDTFRFTPHPSLPNQVERSKLKQMLGR